MASNRSFSSLDISSSCPFFLASLGGAAPFLSKYAYLDRLLTLGGFNFCLLFVSKGARDYFTILNVHAFKFDLIIVSLLLRILLYNNRYEYLNYNLGFPLIRQVVDPMHSQSQVHLLELVLVSKHQTGEVHMLRDFFLGLTFELVALSVEGERGVGLHLRIYEILIIIYLI